MLPAIPGYQVLEQIHESVHSVAFRARREGDQQPVVVKVLKEDLPPLGEVLRYRREFELSAQFKGWPGISQVLSLCELGQRLALVMEDYGAESLRKQMARKRFSLEEVLRIGVAVAEALGRLHEVQVIHKDLNPSNILQNPQTGEVKISDFGISTVLTVEAQEPQSPGVLEGTLAYISPEQTGRVSHSVDFRTDFYSLGVTLYELLTGKLPFSTKDLQELLYCHLARNPVPPDEENPQVPRVLSLMVQKLMAKSPDARYQSAAGIQADLTLCLFQLRETGQVRDFPIGADDFSLRLLIPEKLYGRESDLRLLTEAFDRVRPGRSEMILVSGTSGVGKTSLVRILFPQVSERDGYFLSGKFGQLQRNRPCSAFVDAFEHLLRYILSESKERHDALKRQILEAVGQNATVLFEMIPNLERLLGPQPPVPPLPSIESQNRFNRVFQRFVKVLGTPQHPLVLFIDDLQWADSASLNLIQLMMTAGEGQSLLFVGAYRHLEVGAAHPLRLCLEELRGQVVLGELQLDALRVEQVNQLLADTLLASVEDTAPLARLLHQKTEGNPFFLKEYLHSLFRDGLLRFDRGDRGWAWDMERLQVQTVADNVADLVVLRIQTYPPETQRILGIASCLGNQFDLQELAIALEESPGLALRALRPTLEAGLVNPLGQSYRNFEFDSAVSGDASGAKFRFAHDRIQQAAYAAIGQDEKVTLHRRIGQALLAQCDTREREQRFFDIVNHLDFAPDFEKPQAELDQLASLNLEAARKALASLAPGPAWTYLKTGLALVGAEGWERDHALTLALHDQAVEAASLLADFSRMDELIDEIIGRARTPLQQVKAYQIRIESLTARHHPEEAIRTAISFLGQLGLRVPEVPGKLELALSLLLTKFSLRGRRIPSLLCMPEMEDPCHLEAINIMRRISAASYVSNHNLMAWLIFKQVRMLVRHGNNPWSGSVFASFGLILCAILGAVEQGYQFGKLALEFLQKGSSTLQRSRILFIVNSYAIHWKDPLARTLTGEQKGYQVGLEVGDNEYAAWCAHMSCQHAFLLGRELVELESEFCAFEAAILQLKQEIQLNLHRTFRQTVHSLQASVGDPVVLSGEHFNGEEALPGLLRANDRVGIFAIYVNQLLLCCYFHRPEAGIDNAEAGRAYLPNVRGLFVYARFHFFESLVRLRAAQGLGTIPRRSSLRKVEANLRKLKKWARQGPANHLHPYLLVQAERLRCLGRIDKALSFYERAIQAARENLFLGEEALSTELLALALLGFGQVEEGQRMLREAHYKYRKWGALGKVCQLEQAHEFLGARPV